MSKSSLPSRLRPRLVLPAPRTLRVELAAALVVALALIPEAISFSLIAGVSPRVGLYASCIMAMTIAVVGGRSAMISAATGSTALVVVSLVHNHGAQYLFAAAVLAGAIQIVLGGLRIARAMRFVPRSVMTGFVNALAILIFLAQLRYLKAVPWAVYPLVVAGVAMIFLLPRLTRVVPAPLIAIAVLTALTLIAQIHVPTVHDEGAIPHGLPIPGLPNVPLTLNTLLIIAPYSVTLAAVALLETLLTAQLVDDMTHTSSDKNREARGQGIANIAVGLFASMPGCAMIGQTMMNVKAGARTRISTFFAGAFLLLLIVALGPVLSVIPMAALVSVMVLVSVSTFDWRSVAPATLRRMPRGETLIMVATVGVTVAFNNLAVGVGVGVVIAMALFARRVAHLVEISSSLDENGLTRTYAITGALFFASDRHLVDAFDYTHDPPHIIIDLTHAHIWDASAVAALDTITHRYATHGTAVHITGANHHSQTLHDTLTGQLRGAH